MKEIWRACTDVRVLLVPLAITVLPAGLFASGPAFSKAGYQRVVTTTTSVVVLDIDRNLWRRSLAADSQWTAFRPVQDTVRDLAWSEAGEALWLLTYSNRLVRLDSDNKVQLVLDAPGGTWSIAAGRGGVWVGAISRPSEEEITFSWASDQGELRPAGSAKVPPTAIEAVVLRGTIPLYRDTASIFRMAADAEHCAAFLILRPVVAIPGSPASSIRWVSRGAELGDLVSDFTRRTQLPAILLRHVADVAACPGGWAVLQGFTSFDPDTGDYGMRDVIRRLDRSGNKIADIPLGSRAMGISFSRGELRALMEDGSLRVVSLD